MQSNGKSMTSRLDITNYQSGKIPLKKVVINPMKISDQQEQLNTVNDYNSRANDNVISTE